MPETVKRVYTAQAKAQSIKMNGRTPSPKGSSYPAKPGGSDGKYEHTAAGKTKLNKF